MKNKPSIAKKVASVAAGTALAASLYANAVYQPRNESALEQALDRELQAVVSGEAEVKAMGDGFVVVERAPVQERNVDGLVSEIAQLEAEMVANTQAASEQLVAAYAQKDVVTVAQAPPPGSAVAVGSEDNPADRRPGDPGGIATYEQIRQAAQAISRIHGVPIGATIGTLAQICSNPLVSLAIIEVANAGLQPGIVAAAASNAGGLSAAAQTLIATTGQGVSAAGIVEAVVQAASSNTGNTTVAGGVSTASP